MEFTDFYYPSSTGVNTIHALAIRPEQPVKGVVQIVHGIAEHIDRYRPFMEFLANAGFAVCGNDHLGHGGTAKTFMEQGYFADSDGWNHVVSDVRILHDRISAEYPSVPYIMFGHSMGSFLTRTYLIDHSDAYDLAILSGTAYINPAVLTAGGLMADSVCALYGAKAIGSKLAHIVFKGYNSRIENPKSESDWLSRDEKQVALFLKDPKCGFTCKNGLYRDMLYGMKYIMTQKNIDRMNRNKPVCFVSGDADPVGNYGAGVKQAYKAFCKAQCKDVMIRLYPEGRHEMLNEINRDNVYQDILDWICSRL